MRSVLCAAALVSLCSSVCAERITIVAAVANYITAEDEVDFEVWLDQPFDDSIHRLQITGGDQQAVTGNGDGVEFLIGNHTFTGQVSVPIDEFNMRTFDLVSGSSVSEIETLDLDFVAGFGVREGVMRYIVAMTVPADLLRFDDYATNENTFFYGVAIQDRQGTADVFTSFSSVDEPGYEEVMTPEPSSLVLLGLAHLCWLPRLRKLCRKWRRPAQDVG